MAFAQQAPATNQIRGSKLAVFVPRSEGVPMEEAPRRADAAGRVIASNKMLDDLSRNNGGIEDKAFPCWTGTLVAYNTPDRPFGKTIEYVDSTTGIRYVFPVPNWYRGMKNVVLVAEHPDFRLETDNHNRVVQVNENKVGRVLDFPTVSNRWYFGDSKYDIPSGPDWDEGIGRTTRYLWRTDTMVTLAVRVVCIQHMWHDSAGVDLRRPMSDKLGVAVEEPTDPNWRPPRFWPYSDPK